MDEQAGERCHKLYKKARTQLARKSTPEENITDMMKMSLAWSDPKMSYTENYCRRSARSPDATFSREMQIYFADPKENNIDCDIYEDQDEDHEEHEPY